jgi:hypothetical protein
LRTLELKEQMKEHLPLMLVMTGLLPLVALAQTERTVLLDFGDDISFRGASVPNPDPNGNYWNSVRPGFYFADLVDLNNEGTGIAYGPGAHPTDSYNGPSGDTTINGPADADYDAVALGDLGVDEAVYDYHVGVLGQDSAFFQIEGLDPQKSYTLRIYGAHKYIMEPEGSTTYRVYADAERTLLLASVNLAVGSIGDAHNRDRLAVIEDISPAEDVGIFFFEFGGTDGESDGYINSMSLTYVDEPVVDSSWWAAAARDGYGWRDSGDAISGEAGIGWIQDSHWPWVFMTGLEESPFGAWTYIFAEGGDRGGFWVWNYAGGYYLYADAVAGRYYSYAVGQTGWKHFAR